MTARDTTAPDETTPDDDANDKEAAAGNTGSLAAATNDADTSDPLRPLNRITEDGKDS
jgi:hypothetical protein